jgi:hypothetical protein
MQARSAEAYKLEVVTGQPEEEVLGLAWMSRARASMALDAASCVYKNLYTRSVVSAKTATSADIGCKTPKEANVSGFGDTRRKNATKRHGKNVGHPDT